MTKEDIIKNLDEDFILLKCRLNSFKLVRNDMNNLKLKTKNNKPKRKKLDKDERTIIKVGSILLALSVIGTVLTKNNNKSSIGEYTPSGYINEIDYDNMYILYDDDNNFITIAQYKEGVNGINNLVDIDTKVKYYEEGLNPLNNKYNYNNKISLKDYLVDKNEYKSYFSQDEFNDLKEELSNNKVKEYSK